MKHILIIFLLFLCSCGDSVKKEDLSLLNGYWEIKVVVFPSGDRKEYEMNATVDYIDLTGSEGYRKKVQPMSDGSFVTSDDAENFSVVEQNGAFIVVYKNAMSQWEEEIITLTPTELRLRNADQITYIYSRFQPITLE
jgi:hypothetical protein